MTRPDSTRADLFRQIVNAGVVDAHVASVRENDTHIAMLAFFLDPSSERQKIEHFVRLLQDRTDYAPLLTTDDGTLMTFVHNTQLHHGVQMVDALLEEAKRDITVSIDYGALTMIDKEDDREALMSRIRRYLDQARQTGRGKMCYGTRHYDFCAKGGEETIFTNFFAEYKRITIYNFYKGMPLSEEAEVVSFRDGLLRIKTSLAKAAFLKNEPFTFIRHSLLPDTVKADVVNTLPTRAEVVLNHLRFVDNSPVDRENIRVTPDEEIEAFLECDQAGEIPCKIESIAVNSIAITAAPESIGLCDSDRTRHVTIHFEIPDRKGHTTPMKLPAILRYRKENRLIFSIYPNHFLKEKIESYIARQQTKLITIMQKMVLNFYQG